MTHRVATLFFDMNSFFASVAQAQEPSLMHRPVGVLTTNSPHAACIAASIEAKRRGVKMGTRQDEARVLCPGIVFRVVQHDVCVRYHHAVRAAVETVLPIDRAYSIDEFTCNLMGSQQDLPNAMALGRQVQAAILTQVSPALRCSIGLGPNKLLAKVAAGLEKPGGLHWLLPHILPDRIAHLDLDDLPGISRRMKGRLAAAGITDIHTLYRTDPKEARAIWGSVTGERFVRELRGEVVVWPETQRGMFGHGQVLTGANKSPEGARLVARRLLVKAAARLRREGYFARYLTVGVKCARHGRQSRDGTMPATQDTFLLLQVMQRYWAQLQVAQPVAVQVALGGLVPMAAYIPDLFDPRPAADPSPREALCAQIDALNQRYGQNTIRFGQLPRMHVAYTGAKIAFGRIPDWQDFAE
jgi:nucleotidyltransferase/DNA polymerase involved in DNA repair